MSHPDIVNRLDTVAERLRAEGRPDLAQEVLVAAAALRDDSAAAPPTDLLTTGDAARLLGIHSLNTIKRWAREGILDGYRRGGRVLVSRASVERLTSSPTLAEQRAYERRLDEALVPFDIGDEELPPTSATAVGRKPWDHVVVAPD
jgi:excisionase family DNA binding protein